MEGKKRYFQKYQDFLKNRRNNNNIRLLEENKNIYPLNSNKVKYTNTTEPSFNLNFKNISKIFNDSDSGCLSSLRRQFKSKVKNNINNPTLETNYKTFYTTNSGKNDNFQINNNRSHNNIRDKINNSKNYNFTKNNYINNEPKQIIYDYNNNYNNIINKKNLGKRALSSNNLIRNNEKITPFSNFKLKNHINGKKLNNCKKNNNYNSFLKNNKKNIKKYNSYNKINSFSFDSPILNKELAHILSSYDFKDINDYNDINIDDKSIKIHFRNLLYLVKELSAKNDLLKKELRNKNNLISTLEKQINNKNKSQNSLNNIMCKKYNDNILLDNSVLKSDVLNLENKLKQQKLKYEDIINDYESKLREEKDKNNIMDNNFKKIENKYKYTNNKIFDIKDELKDVTLMKAKLEDMNEKYEVINLEQQKRIEELENQLKVVLTLVKNLFSKENNILYPMRTKLFYEISNLGKNNYDNNNIII